MALHCQVMQGLWLLYCIVTDAGLMATVLHANNLYELPIQAIAAPIHGILYESS